MRGLFYPKLSFAVGANYFCSMPSMVFVTCHYNQKVLYSIILPVFIRAKRVFRSFVVNQFPRMKIATKMFRHYKAMLEDVASTVCHRIEEVIGINLDADITSRGNACASSPKVVSRARRLVVTTSAFCATHVKWGAPLKNNPSFFAAIYTSVPNILIVGSPFGILPLWIYLFRPSYFPNFKHIHSIPFANSLRKGVCHPYVK